MHTSTSGTRYIFMVFFHNLFYLQGHFLMFVHYRVFNQFDTLTISNFQLTLKLLVFCQFGTYVSFR